MKELVVVAIGGNSIIKDNNSQSIEAQEKAVQEVARQVSDMLEGNYNIVLTHGNGPRLGLIYVVQKSRILLKGYH